MSYHFNFVRPGGAFSGSELMQLKARGVSVEAASNADEPETFRVTIRGQSVDVFLTGDELWTARLSDDQIGTTAEFAKLLGARLIGDEGEAYLPDGRVIKPPAQNASRYRVPLRQDGRVWMLIFAGLIFFFAWIISKFGN